MTINTDTTYTSHVMQKLEKLRSRDIYFTMKYIFWLFFFPETETENKSTKYKSYQK